MKIAIASDHRGFDMKCQLAQLAAGLGHEVQDLGPESIESVDYPDFAARVATSLMNDDVDRGILICGTGIGMCIAANKFSGVRAANCNDTVTAEASRMHNDANVVCLSADQLSEQLAAQILSTWLETEFQAGRHARRLQKINDIENGSPAALADT